MNYNHNGYHLVEAPINPVHIEPDKYHFLEAPRMVKGKHYTDWMDYSLTLLYLNRNTIALSGGMRAYY